MKNIIILCFFCSKYALSKMPTNYEFSDIESIGSMENLKQDEAQYDDNSQSTNL